MKANERDSRTEQERFIDRMLKEILGGQRNPGDRLPTESELAAQYDLRKTNVHLALKELELLNAFLVCMFRESDNMIFRVLLRSSRELAHVTYYIVAYTLDTQEPCKTYRTVLDGLTSGHASEAIDYWCGWSDRVTVQYREALLQLGSE